MSIVLLVGVGPMPTPGMERVHAPGLRLYAWMKALLEAGHHLHLGEFSFGGFEGNFKPHDDGRLLSHRQLPKNLTDATLRLGDWVANLQPDCIVALTDIGALSAVNSGFSGPIYVDYNGPPMIERQQQAFSFGNDDGLLDQWMHILPVLLRADRFAVCSASQRLTLLGELGATGRLNHHTCGRELIDVIQPNVPFHHFPEEDRAREVLKRHGVPQDARVVIASGGFNTWFDEETLFKGLAIALGKDPKLHFVCTGGAIPGHVEHVYKRFEERMRGFDHAGRCHLLGWIPHGELLELFRAADVAVNCDLWSLEVETGFRNRLLGWAWSGLRIVSTALGAPSQRLMEMGLLRSFPPGDSVAMANQIEEEAGKGRRRNLEEVQSAMEAEFSNPEILKPLLDWVADPSHAPDLDTNRKNNLMEFHREALHYHRERSNGSSPRMIAREAGETLLGSRLFLAMAKLNPNFVTIARRLRDL